VKAILNPSNQLQEEDTTNNIGVAGRVTVISQPELVLQTVTFPSAIQVRESTAITATVVNVGNAPSATFKVFATLSSDRVLSFDDTAAGNVSGVSLAAGASATVVINTQLVPGSTSAGTSVPSRRPGVDRRRPTELNGSTG